MRSLEQIVADNGDDNTPGLDTHNLTGRVKPRTARQQNEDGTAHIAYYDARGEGYSYIWDGVSDNIQVCIGGYGEPVDHTIPAISMWSDGNEDWPSSLGDILEEFEDTCAQHTNSILGHDGRVV